MARAIFISNCLLGASCRYDGGSQLSCGAPVARLAGRLRGMCGASPTPIIKGSPREAVPVAGHRFEALAGTIDGMPVVMHPGRVHLYQGYSAERD